MKMYRMFSVHATPGEVKNVTITFLLDMFEENTIHGNHDAPFS